MQWIFYERKDNLPLYVYLPLMVKEPPMKYSSSFKLSNVLYKIFIIFYQITPLKLEKMLLLKIIGKK